eukprot:m.63180 g.63180  ORF g.63180 m.63180 type:complete len:417 (+) comp11428_c0_seq4:51-1301(+)
MKGGGELVESDDEVDVDEMQQKMNLLLKSDSVGGIDVEKGTVRCCFPSCNSINAPHKCSRCLSVRYCSRECQVAHWPEHRSMCEEMSRKFNAVPLPRFLAYSPSDKRTAPVVDRLDKLTHESFSPRSLFFSVIVETSNVEAVDSLLSTKEITSVLQSELRQNCSYAIPTDAGLARVMYSSTSPELPQVPDVCTVSASLPSRVDLNTYISNRCYAKHKHDSTVGTNTDAEQYSSPTKSDMAMAVFETLVLIDKTVFPTIQLFRLMRQRVALGVVANQNELIWALLSLDQLAIYDEKIVSTAKTYNVDEEFVILVNGSLIDESEDDTVMLVLPLQAALAFHKQHVEESVKSDIGAVTGVFPHASLVLALTRAHGDDKRRESIWEETYTPYLAKPTAAENEEKTLTASNGEDNLSHTSV